MLTDFEDSVGVTAFIDLTFTDDDTDVDLLVGAFDDELVEELDCDELDLMEFDALDLLDVEDGFDELDFDDDFDAELRDEIELAKLLPPWYKRTFAAHSPARPPSLLSFSISKAERHLLTPPCTASIRIVMTD